jgi:hypothetical protein
LLDLKLHRLISSSKCFCFLNKSTDLDLTTIMCLFLLKDNQEEDIRVSIEAGRPIAAAAWCIFVTCRKMEEDPMFSCWILGRACQPRSHIWENFLFKLFWCSGRTLQVRPICRSLAQISSCRDSFGRKKCISLSRFSCTWMQISCMWTLCTYIVLEIVNRLFLLLTCCTYLKPKCRS